MRRRYGLLALILASALMPALARDDTGRGRLDAGSGGLVLPGLDREGLTADDLEKGTTLLVVWASWSPRCRGIAARIDRLAETWSDRARVASVAFQEEADTVRKAIGRGRHLAPVYLDLSGDFSKRHEVTTLPMLLVFRGGELAFRGRLSADPDTVIERALADDL